MMWRDMYGAQRWAGRGGGEVFDRAPESSTERMNAKPRACGALVGNAVAVLRLLRQCLALSASHVHTVLHAFGSKTQ